MWPTDGIYTNPVTKAAWVCPDGTRRVWHANTSLALSANPDLALRGVYPEPATPAAAQGHGPN